MPPKRAAVPTNTFGGAPKALDKLTGRAPAPASEETEHSSPAPETAPTTTAPQRRAGGSPQSRNTATRQSGKAVSPQSGVPDEGGDDSSTREKVTFYLRPDQVEKLDDLVITYKRRTGRRTNRNALMRQLLDQVDIELLLREG